MLTVEQGLLATYRLVQATKLAEGKCVEEHVVGQVLLGVARTAAPLVRPQLLHNLEPPNHKHTNST